MSLPTLPAVKAWPVLVYGLVTLIILGPLLRPGYVLALDMVFTPSLRMPQSVTSSYLFYGLLHGLNLVIAADILQKVMLSAVFLLAGWGMHCLVRAVGAAGSRGPAAVACYAAGVFYMVNPFTYERLMTGQYGVLLGYALLPWFTRAMLALVLQPGRRRLAAVVVWALAVSVVSIHSIGPMIIIGLALLVARLWQLRGQGRLVAYAAAAAAAWLLASSYWLWPTLTGSSSTARTVGSFTSGDRAAFATIGATAWGRLDNVLSLQGFWAERHDLFRLPQTAVPAWSWLVAVLLAVIAVGAVALWRRQRAMAAALLAVMASGWLLAAGIGGGWLAAHLPFFAGYREPQKFAMLLALGYGVLLAYGVQALSQGLAGWRQGKLLARAVAGACLALPLAITPLLLWGAGGQLRSVDYPAGWYAANARLNSDKGHFETVFLPWHLYLNTNFAGRTVANPAASFFDKPVLISDDPELEGVAPAQPTPRKQAVGSALEVGPQSNRQLGLRLAALDVKYIVVAKTGDYLRYGYLDRQSNLRLLSGGQQSDTILVYLNQAYQARP